MADGKQTAKGQVSSFDLIMSAIILILLVGYLVSSWNVQARAAISEASRDRYGNAGLSALNFMVNSRGIPENWTASDSSPETIGLASRPGVLDRGRLSNFSSMNYSAAKASLGLQEDFYFFVENATTNATLYSAGWDNATEVAYSFTRYAVLDNSPVRVRMRIYETGN